MLKHAMLVAVALIASALLVAFSLSSAVAAEAHDTMQVTATVVTVCTLDAPDLDFGEYTGAEINKDSVWGLQCTTSGTPILVWTWGLGLNFFDGNWHMKKTDSDDMLAYRQVGYEPWAPTDAAGQTTFTLHLRALGGQIVPAGAYADTLSVFATF
jgi:spore coat protein U-like protein